MYIITGPISLLQPKPSLVNSLITNIYAKLVFYMDDNYLAYSFFEKQYAFLKNHFLSHIL